MAKPKTTIGHEQINTPQGTSRRSVIRVENGYDMLSPDELEAYNKYH